MLIPNYPIETPRLSLRPFAADDLDDMFEYHSRPDVVRFLYWEARSREETRKALEQKMVLTQLTEEGARLALAVTLKESGKVIGEVSLVWQSQVHQQGEIGFVFNPAFQGRGYATEAAQVILALGFDKLRLHRIYGRCDALNVASYKLMARLGMRREAHFIQNELFKGEWGDELVYAMLQDEWRIRNEKPV